MKRRWIRGAALVALALMATAPNAARAHCDDVDDDNEETYCDWVVVPSSNVRGDEDQDYNVLGEWWWVYAATAGPLMVYAEIEGETLEWGFPSVSKANSGDGRYVISRSKACSAPVEDIEANGKNQFKASAALDADEVARAIGSMDMWAAVMKSHNHAPQRFRSHALGGVECTATPRGNTPDGTVSISWAGVGAALNLFWSSGASAEVIFDAFDSGSGGKTPETISTLNKSSVTLDLDSYDTGSAYIDDSRSQLRVLGTCDGACKVMRVVLDWDTY